MLSKVDFLATKLHRRWIHKWFEAFCDNTHGGFYERLGENFKPVEIPHKRLVTQCRQLAVYAHASSEVNGIDFSDSLKSKFEFLKNNYFVAHTGGWRFSVTPEGRPLDNTYDLYGNAFVIFSLCFYDQAIEDENIKSIATKTLKFITTNFKHEGLPGFVEALDGQLHSIPDKIRRQNPHMHLFEACLFAYELWRDESFINCADEIYDLFTMYFFDAQTKTLGEFFEDDFTPHKTQGHIVEPGHHFEWVWLLQKYAELKGDTEQLKEQRAALLGFANKHGFDNANGGIYDALDREGGVIEKTKRVWPFTEGLKANAMMLDHEETDKDFIKTRVRQMIKVFDAKYMEPRGFWTESLTEDLKPATDYMPGTTPYHVYFGIVETLKHLKARGKSKSWFSTPRVLLYRFRRKLSKIINP